MGIIWFEALVLIVIYSAGVLGENNRTDLENEELLPSHPHMTSGIAKSNKSENNNISRLQEQEEIIEILHINSGKKHDKESLSRFNYSSFDRNEKNSFYSGENRNATNVKATKLSTTNSGGNSCSDSSNDFPNIFTQDDLKHGAIALVILVGMYGFTTLAIICDSYFLPCMEVLCEVLNLSQDVAAATFMSIATSTPELFVNIIGTFITKSDLGVGTIVGSSLFNSLGVASIGCLAASKPVQLGWWPLTRDTIIYMSAVCLLIIITNDNVVYWYEGLALFLVYFFYFILMFNNHRIWRIIENYLPKNKNTAAEDNHVHDKEQNGSIASRKVSTISPYGSYMEDVHHHSVKHFQKFSHDSDRHFHVKDDQSSVGTRKESTNSPYGSYMEDTLHAHTLKHFDKNSIDMQIKDPENNLNKSEDVDKDSVFNFPKNVSFWKKCLWIYISPIKFVLRFAIPDPKKHRKLFPLTFVMCIVFIGLNSYMVSWMITLTGNLLQIPDAVLGFTFLAAGGCLPESISITIMSRRGEGSMGVSNSLGANTMNILMSLGLPWFLKTILMGTDAQSFLNIESGVMEYIIMGLLLVAFVLYITLYFNNFQLRRRAGVILLLVYLTFVTVSIVAELLTDNC